MSNVHQAHLIGFLQRKEYEEAKREAEMLKAMAGKPAPAMPPSRGRGRRKGRK